jgi:hypothetical protein
MVQRCSSQSPICAFVIDLIDLSGRGAPLLLDHQQLRTPTPHLRTERVLNVLKCFQQKHERTVMVFPFTAITPYATMHDDVCSLAMEKKVSMVIVPFHKLWNMNGAEEKPRSVRRVNQNILRNAPCSVGILVDRVKKMKPLTSHNNLSVGVIFIGGGDDREALAIGSRMAKHPNAKLLVLHPTNENHGNNSTSESEKDADFICNFMEANKNNNSCSYKKEVMKDKCRSS